MSIRVRYSTGQEAHLTGEGIYKTVEQLKVGDELAVILDCNTDFGSSARNVPAEKLKADIDVLVMMNGVYPPLEFST